MNTATEAPRKPGNPNWTRKASALQQPTQEPLQEPGREGVSISADGRVVVQINGETFTRKRHAETNEFDIPAYLIPEGFEYQWNLVTVHGEPFVKEQIAMAENGWRPVPAGRHPGMFMPKGTAENAAIMRGGLRLDERPTQLSEEAREEDRRNAAGQLRGAKEALNLTMPQGFTRNNADLRRAEQSRTSRTVGPAPDISRPALQIDDS